MGRQVPKGLALLALFVGVYAKIQFGSEKTAELGNEVASFMIIGDWGGSPVAPYTTPGQLAAAAAMAKVAVEQLATFVVSTGGNFYGGLLGARLNASSRGRVPAPLRSRLTLGADGADPFLRMSCVGWKDCRRGPGLAWAGGSTSLPQDPIGLRKSGTLSAICLPQCDTL